MSVSIPKMGEKVATDKFFVSKMNIRIDEKFGQSLEDATLTQHLGKETIVQPFIARPEGKGFGVVIGRRRFLAKKKSGAKTFIVGQDCLIKEMTDKEAFDSSLRENLPVFREELNPILRAKKLQDLINMKSYSLRQLASTWRVPTSNLSDWMRLLELSKSMQNLVEKGLLGYTDALKLARLNLDVKTQDKLAIILEKQGFNAFISEVNRLQAGKEKRGLPKGKYFIPRPSWDLTKPEDEEAVRRLEVLAKSMNMEIHEYCKKVLTEHAMGKR